MMCCSQRLVPYLCVLSALLLAACAYASPTTPWQAAQAVGTWLAMDGSPLGAGLGTQVAEVRAYPVGGGAADYYVVELLPGGFVIVAGDDQVEPIVAFAPEGTYDASRSDPLGALIAGDLVGRVEVLRESEWSLYSTSAASRKWARLLDISINSIPGPPSDERVPPLMQSKWSQETAAGSACYNYYTPPNAPGTSTNYPCGCVATAMAQLMRCLGYPAAGPGTKSFTIDVDGIAQSRTLRGGDGWGGPYSYADMPLAPGASTTQAQRQAIGALCHDASVAIGTQYTADASSASLSDAVTALTGTFHFANAVFGYDGGGNIGSGLPGMINPNLDAGMLVILAIDGAAAGHAAVCDGYGYNLSTLYHHLNLGWAGIGNVWYNLPAIDTPNGNYSSVVQCAYNIYSTGTGEIISGRVVDSSHNPIAGATVTASRAGGAPVSAATNSLGVYALTGLRSLTQYTVTPDKTGLVFASRGAATGASTNYEAASGNVWAIDFTAAADTTPPTCTVTGPASPTYTAPISFGIIFSEPVTGLTAGEIVVTGGAGSLTGSGMDYTLTVTPSGYGQITCGVPAGAAQDASANPNTASNTASVEYLNVGPVVAITSPTAAGTCGRTCATVDVAGSAVDSDGITGVSWSNDRGGNGACVGTTSWSVAGIALQLGQNVITITATDGVANTGTAVLTVTFSVMLPGGAWTGAALVSLPIIPDLADPKPNVGFNGNGWCAYDPAASAYAVYPDQRTWFAPASATIGRGFWAFFPTGSGSIALPCGTVPAQNQPATIHLQPGWNIIGAPFASPVNWSLNNITVVESGRAPVALRDAYYLVADYAWGWDGSTSAYYLVYDTSIVPTATGTLDPWKGYWFKAKKACDLIIPPP